MTLIRANRRALRVTVAIVAAIHVTLVGVDAGGRADYALPSDSSMIESIASSPAWTVLHAVAALMLTATALWEWRPGASLLASGAVLISWGWLLTMWAQSITQYDPTLVGAVLALGLGVVVISLYWSWTAPDDHDD